MGALTDVIESIQPAAEPLYRLEVFTNGLGVVINCLTTLEGATSYESSLQVMTQRGPAHITFKIEDAVSPLDALQKWHIWAKDAVQKAAVQMKEQESRIVVPSAMPDLPTRAPFTRKPAAN